MNIASNEILVKEKQNALKWLWSKIKFTCLNKIQNKV